MTGNIEFLSFKNRSEASIAAANRLAELLRHDLGEDPQSQASLVVSGGSTPGPCFEHLSNETMDWSRVTVLPSDERWVPGNHPDSNERLVRASLLRGEAGTGKFLPFFREGIKAEQAPLVIERDLQALSRPFSVSLLGMGQDGHFASLFPDYKGLEKALDPQGVPQCIVVQTAGSPHLRISLTLSALLGSKLIVLLIFGDEKRAVFEAASRGGSPYPVESLLLHSRIPVNVIWAP
mgnify:CR=1 FL=1